MSENKTIGDMLAAQRQTVAACETHLQGLHDSLLAATGERDRIANDPTTGGTYGNRQLEQAEQAIRNIEAQIETVEAILGKDNHTLQRLEQAQVRHDKGNTQSKKAEFQERILEQQIAVAELDTQGTELLKAMVDDPDNVALQEDAALIQEKRTVATERLEQYERVYSVVEQEDEANEQADRILSAIGSRNAAVGFAKQRVKIAEKIDAHLAELAPLLREWREVDDSVCAAAQDTVNVLSGTFDFAARSRVAHVARDASPLNCIGPAVAQALLLANVQDVTRSYLEMNYKGVLRGSQAIRAKELAADSIPALAARLDDAITNLVGG